MKIPQFLVVASAIVVIGVVSSTQAALVESVESARTTAAMQKIDGFLGEKVVAAQLTAMGMTRAQVSARLSQLSEAQVEQLAAQVDLIQTGGTIQSGNPNPLGPIGCILHELHSFLTDVYHLVFCWGRPK
jgi:hypothetical protein